jgi:hypothetical protein
MLFESHTGIIDNADAMNLEQKNSFLKGYRAVQLPIGFELWRFVSKQTDSRFGAFWVDAQTMKSIMQILHTNNNFSETYKKDNVRNSLAVLSEWSNLSWRVKIRLRKEVIAYIGEIGTQKKFLEQENIFSFGGREPILKLIETRYGQNIQYVIPRFKRLPNTNDWASIEHFVHI